MSSLQERIEQAKKKLKEQEEPTTVSSSLSDRIAKAKEKYGGSEQADKWAHEVSEAADKSAKETVKPLRDEYEQRKAETSKVKVTPNALDFLKPSSTTKVTDLVEGKLTSVGAKAEHQQAQKTYEQEAMELAGLDATLQAEEYRAQAQKRDEAAAKRDAAAQNYYNLKGKDAVRAVMSSGQATAFNQAVELGVQIEELNQALEYVSGENATDLIAERGKLIREQATYLELLSKAGYDAERAVDYEVRQVREQAAAKEREANQAWAKDNKLLATLGSIATAPVQGVDYIHSLVDSAGHSSTGKPENYVPLSASDMQATAMTQDLREGASSEWGNVGKFLYNTGLSIADSALMIATFGKGAGILLGMGAASTTTKDVLERGGTNNQALMSGLAAGAAEMIFEKYSIESLLSIKHSKTFVAAVLKQMGAEASEEALTEISNILTDTAIMGENSNSKKAVEAYAKQYVKQYMAQGMSREAAEAEAKKAAERQVFWDNLKQVGLAGLGGALSGGAMGGGTSVGSYAVTSAKENVLGRALSQEHQSLLSVAEKFAEGSETRKMADSIVASLNAGKTDISSDQWVRLAYAMDGERDQHGPKLPNGVPDPSVEQALHPDEKVVGAEEIKAEAAKVQETQEQIRAKVQENAQVVEQAQAAQAQAELADTQQNIQQRVQENKRAVEQAQTVQAEQTQKQQSVQENELAAASLVQDYAARADAEVKAKTQNPVTETATGVQERSSAGKVPTDTNVAQKAVSEANRGARKGLLDYVRAVHETDAGVRERTQNATVDMLNAAFKRRGFNVQVSMQSLGKDGKNGQWTSDGNIVLNSDTRNTQGQIYWTLSHELFHDASHRKGSDTGEWTVGLAKKLDSVASSLYGKKKWAEMKADAYEAQLEAHMADGMTREQAAARLTETYMNEEFAADALSAVFARTDALNKLVQEDRSAVVKIRDWLQDRFSDLLTGNIQLDMVSMRHMNDLVKKVNEALTSEQNRATDKAEATTQEVRRSAGRYDAEEAGRGGESEARRDTERDRAGGLADSWERRGSGERAGGRNNHSPGMGEAGRSVDVGSEKIRRPADRIKEVAETVYRLQSVIKPHDEMLKRDPYSPAYSEGGVSYIDEAAPEELWVQIAHHEPIHQMKQLKFGPYRDFIPKTAHYFKDTDATLRLIEGAAKHRGIDPKKKKYSDLERTIILDEVNAMLHGGYLDNPAKMMRIAEDVLIDPWGYFRELLNIVEQFKTRDVRYSAPVRANTNTPEFRAWFHDDSGELSNPDGTPKIFLRGDSFSGATKFPDGAENYSGGIFFSTRRDVADNYAEMNSSLGSFGVYSEEFIPRHLDSWNEAFLWVESGALGPLVALDHKSSGWKFMTRKYDPDAAINGMNGLSKWKTVATYPNTQAGLDRFNAEYGELMSGNRVQNPGFMQAYLSAEKTLVVDAKGRGWHNVDGRRKSTNETAKEAWEKGYDCVVIHNVVDGGTEGEFVMDEDGYEYYRQIPITVTIVKDSGQVKSVYNTGSFDRNNPDVRYSAANKKPHPDNVPEWDKQVDALLKGEFHDRYKRDGAHRSAMYVLYEPPALYQELGLSDLPLIVTVSHALRDMAPRYDKDGNVIDGHAHDATETQYRKLPELIRDPVAIFKSDPQSDHYGGLQILTAERDSMKNPFFVTIKADQNEYTFDGVSGPAHFVNLFARKNYRNFLRAQFANNGVLYVNKEKLDACPWLSPYTAASPTWKDIESGVILQQKDPTVKPGERRFSVGGKLLADPLYSQMEKVLNEYKGEKIGAASLIPYLKNHGVKQEEIKWSGIEQYLADKKSVTKDELFEFLRANELVIEDVVLSNNREDALTAEERKELEEVSETVRKNTEELRSLAELLDRDTLDEFLYLDENGDPPSWLFGRIGDKAIKVLVRGMGDREQVPSNAALLDLAGSYADFGYDDPKALVKDIREDPAGFAEDHRDVLEEIDAWYLEDYAAIKARNEDARKNWEAEYLAEAQKMLQLSTETEKLADRREHLKQLAHTRSSRTAPQYERYATEPRSGRQNYREVLFRLPEVGGNLHSPHWAQTDVLAHTRLQDMVDAEGKKVLFVDEVQSDWHQAGRDEGYTPEELTTAEREYRRAQHAQMEADEAMRSVPGGPEYDAEYDEARARWNKASEAEYAAQDRYFDLLAKYGRDTVPDAPYKDTWHEYVLKRILRMAAEGGYDKVAWTTGQMQADRYNLNQYINEIGVANNGEGGYFIDANETYHDQTPEQVIALLGHDLGRRAMEKADSLTPYEVEFLEGAELEIGGEGMKNFYDVGGKSSQNIPKFLNKYLKPWGVKVQSSLVGKDLTSTSAYRKDGVEGVMRIFQSGMHNQHDLWLVPGVDITEQMREDLLYKGQPRYSAGTHSVDYAPTFYSKMEQEIGASKQAKMGASSVVAYLKGRGVKDEEIKWSGIEQWLEGKKSVSKEELLEFAQLNSIELETVVKGGTYLMELSNEDELLEPVMNPFTGEAITGAYDFETQAAERVRSLLIEHDIDIGDLGPSFDEYPETRVENGSWLAYHNNLPWANGPELIMRIDIPGFRADSDYIEMRSTMWDEYKTPGGDNYRELLYKMPESDYSNQAMRVHWRHVDEGSGVLAHARVQDFETEDGTMLFIEEIQSDWHNAGQKSGYVTKDMESLQQELRDLRSKNVLNGEMTEAEVAREAELNEALYPRYAELNAKLDALKVQMTTNPLLSSALDKIAAGKFNGIRHYAENSVLSARTSMYLSDLFAEGIRLTYKEREAVGEFIFEKDEWSREYQEYTMNGGREAELANRAPDAPYSKTYHEYVLKRLIREAAENGYASIGWTTGKMQEERWSSEYAEGYRIEYDQDIPKFLNKYGKQWGAKVEKTHLNLGEANNYRRNDGLVAEYQADLEYWQWELEKPDNTAAQIAFILNKIDYAQDRLNAFEAISKGPEIWTMKLTDQMREDVLYKGQPRYSASKKTGGNTGNVNPDTGYERGSVADSFMRIWNVGSQEKALDLLEEAISRLMELQAERAEQELNNLRTVVFRPRVTENVAERNKERIEKLIEKYGMMPQTSAAQQEVRLPKQIDDETIVAGATQTMMAAEVTNEVIGDEMVQGILSGDAGLTYHRVGDKATLDAVDKEFEQKGFQQMRQDWEHIFEEGKITKQAIAKAEKLYVEACENKDVDAAMKLAAEIAAAATRAGQTVQAMTLLKKMTPSGQAYYIQKAVDRLNKEPRQKNPITLDEKLVKALLDAKTREELDIAVDNLMQHVADQVPVTLADKWNTWRYFAMLGNPRTHIRNLFGNAIFTPARLAKDVLGTGLEHLFLPEEKRTKSIVASKELRDFAAQDAEDMKGILRGGGKYNPADMIRDRRTIFGNVNQAKTPVGKAVSATLGKAVEKGRKKNSELLEVEDWIFLKAAYQRALSHFLSARGATAASLNTKKGRKLLEEARLYAVNEAQRATYRDMSKLAGWLNNAKRQNKFAEIFLDGIVPFTKTPINIVKRGLEYSPLGLAKTLYDGVAKVRKGTMDGSELIDELSANLTGTGVALLGMLLSHLGLLTGALGDDDEDKFRELQGEQSYSIHIDGVGSYTIDWMAPVALPLFVGAEIYNTLAADYSDVEAGQILSAVGDGMASILEPMLSLSMLDGLNDALSANKYGDSEDALWSLLSSVGTGYISQAVPTIMGQISRTADPDRRTTFVKKGEGTVEGMLKRFWQNSVQGKVPVYENEKMAYIDEWGRTDTTGSVLLRAFENFLSPGYINPDKGSDVDEELTRLSEALKDTSVMPNRAQKYFTVNKETYAMSQEEYQAHLIERGQTSYQLVSDFIHDPAYQGMTDAERAKVIEKIYDYASQNAKYHTTSEYQRDNWIGEMEDYLALGGDAVDYLVMKAKSGGSVSVSDLAFERDDLSASEVGSLILGDASSSQRAPSTFNDPYAKGYVYELTGEQQAKYTETFDRLFNERFSDLFYSEEYRSATAAERKELVSDLRSEVARETKWEMADWLNDRGIDSKLK